MASTKDFKKSAQSKSSEYSPIRKVNREADKWRSGTKWGDDPATSEDAPNGINLKEALEARRNAVTIEPIDSENPINTVSNEKLRPEARPMHNRIPNDPAMASRISQLAKNAGIQPVPQRKNDSSLDEGYPNNSHDVSREELAASTTSPGQIYHSEPVTTGRTNGDNVAIPPQQNVSPKRNYSDVRPPVGGIPNQQAKVSKENEKPVDPVYIVDRTATSNHIRVALPSNFVPYRDFNDLQIRTFKPRDLARLYRAVVDTDFSTVVDTIDNTSTFDVRDLTPSDFRYLMFWQRLNSYPATPFEVPWTSRYGNENKTTVVESILDIKELKITHREFMDNYGNFGLQFPTIRDVEMIQANREKLGPEDAFMFERVQYIVGETFEEKVDRLDDGGIAMLEMIRELQKHTEHGVVEYLMLQDEKFDLEKAIAYLDNEVTRIEIQLGNMDRTSQEYRVLDVNRYELSMELKEMDNARSRRINYVPKEERIDINMNALQFFPNI